MIRPNARRVNTGRLHTGRLHTGRPSTGRPNTGRPNTGRPAATARRTFAALGTTAVLVVTDVARMPAAERRLRSILTDIDRACSRFRTDSEPSRLHARAGTTVTVTPLLAQALAVALRAAEVSGGLVDPTVGTAVRALGYDRDFAAIAPDSPSPVGPTRPAPAWRRIRFDPSTRCLLVPRGIDLDLGATAKALAADLAAADIAANLGCGALVSLGGDIATAGEPPDGGWRISVGDDHADGDGVDVGVDVGVDDGIGNGNGNCEVVTIVSGGLATSSTTRRTWRRAGRVLHHIVDPRTGDIPQPVWRTVSVAAASCVDANIASTAAIVRGADAAAWLTHRSLPARLVSPAGAVMTVADWPANGSGSTP